MQLDLSSITKILEMALLEDIGNGDVTSKLLIDENATARMKAVARHDMVACGLTVAAEIFRLHDKNVKCTILAKEGDWVKAGQPLLVIEGAARKVLEAERTMLNMLQRMCGVATISRQAVDLVAGTGVILLDTRKTIPGLRVLDKYSTSVGGVQNHRMRLDDMILIKDNHIAVVGSIAEAVKRARQHNAYDGHLVKKMPLSEVFINRARELRKNATNAEKLLWELLRNNNLMGLKFRRQHQIPPYTVDFFCNETGVIIELDGGQHNEEANIKKDNKRAAYLKDKGYKVLRFWNNDVLSNPEGICESILNAAPHPTLSQGERALSGLTQKNLPLPSGEGRGEGLHGDSGKKLIIVVECDNLEQVSDAVKAGADRIMLDNMSPDEIRQAVEMAGGKVELEASGGINMKSLRQYAETGVDYISLGFLTHSVKAADIGLDIAIS